MSHRNGSNGKTEYRRTLVAQALIEHPSATQRQIQENVGKSVLNPETGKPYSLGTINNDFRVIRAGWRAKAESDYGGWVGSELAKLERLEEKGWQGSDYDLVLKCMQRRAKLLGLDKPSQFELGGKGKDGAITVQLVGIDPDAD